MQEEEAKRLVAFAYKMQLCPNCEKEIADRMNAYGSGSLADGLFCSLDCFASFWYRRSGPGPSQKP
jgi:hypothetical protein